MRKIEQIFMKKVLTFDHGFDILFKHHSLDNPGSERLKNFLRKVLGKG